MMVDADGLDVMQKVVTMMTMMIVTMLAMIDCNDDSGS